MVQTLPQHAATETGRTPLAPPVVPRETPRERARARNRRWYAVAPTLSLVAFVGVWKLAVVLWAIPAFLLPPPEAVGAAFVEAVESGVLWPHVRVTLVEAMGGAALGVAVAVVLGYLIVHVPLLDRTLAPFIAASQATPVVAIAPILILWFGTGLLPKVLVCALIVFFPVLVTWAVGLRGIERDLVNVALLAGANRWQIVRYVEVPLALPNLLGGVRIACTLAVTGAVVGEFVSAREGLGYLLKQAEFLYDTPLKFVALFCLMGIAAVGYTAVALIERTLLAWKED